MTTNFNITWGDQQNTLKSTITNLKEHGDFCDVTLIGDDASTFAAHKIVLSSASTFFESLMTNAKECNNPSSVMIMTGFKEQHLKYLMSFIYVGEAIISHEILEDFLELVKWLNLHGLGAPNQINYYDKSYEDVNDIKVNSHESYAKYDKPKINGGKYIPENKEETTLDNSKKVVCPKITSESGLQVINNFEYKLEETIVIERNARNIFVPTKQSNKKYPCGKCGQFFRAGHNMKVHVKSKHSKRDKAVKCRRTFCSTFFDTLEEQQKHTSSCILRCTVQGCHKQFTRQREFEAHRRFHMKLPRGYFQRPSGNQEGLKLIKKDDDVKTFEMTTTKPVNDTEIAARLKGIWDTISNI